MGPLEPSERTAIAGWNDRYHAESETIVKMLNLPHKR